MLYYSTFSILYHILKNILNYIAYRVSYIHIYVLCLSNINTR